MSRRTTVAGLLGCALLAAPVASSSQGPTALAPQQAAADSAPAAAATGATEVPLPDAVVVPSSSGARSWASGAAPTGVAPERLSSVVLDAYTRAAALAPERCHLTVPLLAAIGQVESGNLVGRALDADHRATPAIVGPRLDGGAFRAVADTDKGQLDGDRRFDRALGPLQFLPSTWRSVGVDLDADGTRDPQSIYDAAGGAMVYLCSEGRDLAQDADLRDAVLSYNRSQAYLSQVLRWKNTFDAAELDQLSSLPAFSSWAVATAVAGPESPESPEGPRVDVAEAVRPVPVGTRAPRPSSTPNSVSTGSTGGTGTAPVRPTPGPGTTTDPATPVTPGTPATPGAPATPAIPGGTPAPDGPVDPADPTAPADPADPADPTAPADPAEPGSPTPDPTPTPAPTPVPAAVPALVDLPVCLEPGDPSLPAPAPVDAVTHPLLVPGETEGTVLLPDGTLVTLEQLCQGTPPA